MAKIKLKVQAEPKAWKWFFILCFVMLYVVAFVVTNLSRFSDSKGTLPLTFNPLEAFIPENLVVTLILFIFIMLFSIIAVEKSIFKFKEGFGFKSQKPEKTNYSRWAKEKEVRKFKGVKKLRASDPTFQYAGIPLQTDKKNIYVDDGEAHSLIVGTTGSGKTSKLVRPLMKILAKAGESMILTDPKGELYESEAPILEDLGYDVVVINIREPKRGNAWNPMNLPYQLYKEGNVDKATELLDDLAMNIIYTEGQQKDPFWEQTSADYFSGLSLGLFEDAKEEEINLNSISYMTTIGEDRYKGSNYIKEYFNDKDKFSPAYSNVASFLFAPSETKGSILSVFKQKIKIFSSKESLSEMLSYSDFDMRDIGKKKTAVFLVIQDEKKTYHALATIFTKQVYETLIDVAYENGGKLPIRTNFILDEFANMPPLKDVTTMITAARSRKIRFNLIIQNFAQLTQVYGRDNAETIKGNCSNLVYLLTSELAALEEISKLLGDVKNKDKDDKFSNPRPLMTVNELQRLKFGTAIINKDRVHPFKAKLPFDHEYDFRFKDYEAAEFPEREKRAVQMFDIVKFVKDRDKKKLMELINDEEPEPESKKIEPKEADMDIDSFIKKLDAKIAALEEEEKQKKEKILTMINSSMISSMKIKKEVIKWIPHPRLYI